MPKKGYVSLTIKEEYEKPVREFYLTMMYDDKLMRLKKLGHR